MSPVPVPCAASSLLTAMLGDAAVRDVPLAEVARTRLAVHYETGRDDVPVLCVATPDAVRLPPTVLTPTLPSGPLTVHAGGLRSDTGRWRITRWWTPSRPTDLVPPRTMPLLGGTTVPAAGSLVPGDLVGSGPGLTPSGDDVLAGALVAAYAVADPRLPRWRSQTEAALATNGTTAVSRAMLRHAVDGWAVPELADFVTAVCTSADAGPALARLLAVGHSSGPALAGGALHTLTTATLEGAA